MGPMSHLKSSKVWGLGFCRAILLFRGKKKKKVVGTKPRGRDKPGPEVLSEAGRPPPPAGSAMFAVCYLRRL